jgi:regulatory protein
MEPQFQRALRHAIRLLARKGYFENALRDKIRTRCPDEVIVEKVIDKLKSLNYLNDLLLAADLTRTWLSERLWGRRRILHELTRRGLARETAEACVDRILDEHPESEPLAKASAKWRRLHGPVKTQADRKKLADYLARQGFDFADIREHLPPVTPDREDEPYDWQ